MCSLSFLELPRHFRKSLWHVHISTTNTEENLYSFQVKGLLEFDREIDLVEFTFIFCYALMSNKYQSRNLELKQIKKIISYQNHIHQHTQTRAHSNTRFKFSLMYSVIAKFRLKEFAAKFLCSKDKVCFLRSRSAFSNLVAIRHMWRQTV